MRLQQGLRGGREPWTPSPVSGSASPSHHYGPASRRGRAEENRVSWIFRDKSEQTRASGTSTAAGANSVSRHNNNSSTKYSNCYLKCNRNTNTYRSTHLNPDGNTNINFCSSSPSFIQHSGTNTAFIWRSANLTSYSWSSSYCEKPQRNPCQLCSLQRIPRLPHTSRLKDAQTKQKVSGENCKTHISTSLVDTKHAGLVGPGALVPDHLFSARG